jgi:excisionase family DNA binding protein
MTILEFPQQPTSGEPLQVTIKEAARLLAFDTATIRRKIKRGELDATGHGQSRRVTMASLRAYVERNRAA